MLDADGVYRQTGPAKVFTHRAGGNRGNQGRQPDPGGRRARADCRGPMGAGMEETYQLTSALRYLPFGKHVAVVTDARFSGVSTATCLPNGR